MSNAMMVERTGLGVQGLGATGLGPTGLGTPTGMAGTSNFVMVPRCTFKVETCQGGLRITCACDDKVAATMVQNLCTMLQGGMCSCCVTLNGMVVCTCNLTMGLCRCENTANGVTVTCTSGDQKCAEMIQACCNCLNATLRAGCTCCLLINNTPVCCGCA